MPELPEVTTTVRGINDECAGFTIQNVWTDLAVMNPTRKDFYETIKYLPYFKHFQKQIIGSKIIQARRRGKNILIELDNKKNILIHMKMTGHMMVGKYKYTDKPKPYGSWQVAQDEKNDALLDPFNRFIHVVFTITKNKKEKHLVLCDSRKFAKVTILENADQHSKHLHMHGPEPLDPDITYPAFAQALDIAPANSRPIKTLLMDTRTIAGIGNIYSDEMLFMSSIHPESIWSKIPSTKKKALHIAMLKVLKKGIEFGGDSMSDYRNIYGKRGEFQAKHNAYKKNGEKCNKKKCTGVIERKIVNSRSAHYCPNHQEIYK